MIDRRAFLLAPSLLLATAVPAAAVGGLRWEGRHLLLRVKINGKPTDALIDFNVRRTLIDRRHARMLGVASAGDGVIIETAGRRLGPLKEAVIDLTDYANYALRGRIGLVLGRDLFLAGPWRLDLGIPLLLPVTNRDVRRGRPLPLSDRSGFPTIPVAINGVTAQAALSFRDLDAMRVGAVFAARIGLARPRGTTAVRDLAAGGSAVGISRLDIADIHIDDVDAALEANDHAPDVWLGPAILRRFRIGIDLAADTLWLAPA